MSTNFFPSDLQWIGLAKEDTYGTAVDDPTIWVPCTSPKWTPDINPLTDQAMRGLMGKDYQQIGGMRYDELTYTTFLYLDSVYPHLLSLFGKADTVTGTDDPATHTTSLYNGSGTDGAQPPSYTGFWFDAAGKCQQIPGMQIASLKLDVKADELVTLEVTWNGLPATEIDAPTNTPTTDKPMPSWNTTIEVAGTAVTDTSEVSLTYTRDTKMLPTITGSQTPVAIYAGALSVAGTLTAVYQGVTDVRLADYLANTQPSLSVKCAPAGDTTHSLQIDHSVCAFDKAEVSGSGDWMEITGTIKALMNSTDALDSKLSPGKVTFLSAQTDAF